MNDPKRAPRILVAALGAVSALAALWQLYLFFQFRNAEGMLDPEGGTLNLWLAVAAVLVACAAGAYLFFSVVNQDKEDVIHITS